MRNNKRLCDIIEPGGIGGRHISPRINTYAVSRRISPRDKWHKKKRSLKQRYKRVTVNSGCGEKAQEMRGITAAAICLACDFSEVGNSIKPL